MRIRKCLSIDKKIVLLKQSSKRFNSRKAKTFLKDLEKINQGREENVEEGGNKTTQHSKGRVLKQFIPRKK